MYLKLENPADFAATCRNIDTREGEYLFICLSRAHLGDLDEIIAALDAAAVRFFGGVFPAVIHQGAVREEGAIVQVYPLITEPVAIAIDGEEIGPLDGLPAGIHGAVDKPTCLILADFSCIQVAELVRRLFDRHGNQVNYFGAGVGDGERIPKPVLFSNAGRFGGSGLVAYIDRRGTLGLRHGWSRYSEPIVATRTDGCIIKELDWEPAKDVYRRLVGDAVADSLSDIRSFPEAKRYPLGISRGGGEDVVRDPLVGQDAAQSDILLLSEVPQHSVMHVLNGDPPALIKAAEDLGTELAEVADGETCLLFNCFSRALLLDEIFPEELKRFEAPFPANLNVEGALALGEIASDGESIPDFHNKTITGIIFSGA